MAIVFLPNDNPPNNTTTNTPSEYDYTRGCAPTFFCTCTPVHNGQWQYERTRTTTSYDDFLPYDLKLLFLTTNYKNTADYVDVFPLHRIPSNK